MSRSWLVVFLVTVCFVSMVDAVVAGISGTQTWLWSGMRLVALVGLVVSALRPEVGEATATPQDFAAESVR